VNRNKERRAQEGQLNGSPDSAAHKRLKQLGVDDEGIIVAGKRIRSRTVIWTAGVTPSPARRWLNAETDRSGRVRIEKELTVPGHPEIFVGGDTATLDQDGRPLPGVAQVAIQQGRDAGRLIRRRLETKAALKPFHYFRQRQHGSGRKGLRRLGERRFAHQWFSCVACVGQSRPAVSGAVEPARQCLCAMGLDLLDWTARFGPDHKSPHRSTHSCPGRGACSAIERAVRSGSA
jgi:hypothetical protein